MIAAFPKLYPDELIYSLFARYYAKSGYLAYAFIAEDLYANSLIKPSIEFINKLTPNSLKLLTMQMPMENLVEKHTMFPYYARFISKNRRCNALDSLVNMNNAYINSICIPKSKNCIIRYLRYCPVCFAEDRKQYGETYWHRLHQLSGVDVCPTHGCYLHKSTIPINSKGSPSLFSAEECIDTSAAVLSGTQLEFILCKYIANVFMSDMDMTNDISAARFLHSRLENTKYLSQRGEQRNMTLLYSDLVDFYKTVPDIPIKEQWQLQKIFSNHHLSTYEICLVAMFLGIPETDLIQMLMPEKTQHEIFDARIKVLHMQGLNYRQIANEMKASYDVVKSIGEGRYKANNSF